MYKYIYIYTYINIYIYIYILTTESVRNKLSQVFIKSVPGAGKAWYSQNSSFETRFRHRHTKTLSITYL